MRLEGNAIVTCGAVCAIALGLATSVHAEAGASHTGATPDEASSSRRSDRWVPSLAFVGGANIQEQSAIQASTCRDGGPGDLDLGVAPCNFIIGPGPAALRTPVSNTDVAVDPFVGANVQVMSPSLDSLPGRPRLFLSGELNLIFGATRNLAIESDPSRVSLPPTVTDPVNTSSLLLNGTGSRTTVKSQTLAYGAGIGAAFPFKFRGRNLWIKPSLVWTRFELKAEGLTVAGLKDDPATLTLVRGSQIREILLSDQQTQAFNGIGPGLELELEAGEYGPLGVTVFANANTYRILGDRTIELRDSYLAPALPFRPPGNPNGLPEDLYEAGWTVSMSPWRFRAAVGMRIDWLGH